MKPFRELTIQEKLNTCYRCQKILSKSFPNSEYVVTKGSLNSGIDFYRKKIESFDGCVFECDGAMVFFKRGNVVSEYNKQQEFLNLVKSPHDPNGNCLFVDFMAADISDKNYPQLYEFFFNTQGVEFVMASRRGNILLETLPSLKIKADKMGSAIKLIASLVP